VYDQQPTYITNLKEEEEEEKKPKTEKYDFYLSKGIFHEKK
jgi:hypothetical protein